MSTLLYGNAVRVALADPPAFTPPYDHALAAALARAGADATLLTSPFRFGDVPAPQGYERRERFYPLSSRLFRRSRARLPLKALEHLAVLRALARVDADALHVQWLAWPRLDAHLRLAPVRRRVEALVLDRLAALAAGRTPAARAAECVGILALAERLGLRLDLWEAQNRLWAWAGSSHVTLARDLTAELARRLWFEEGALLARAGYAG